MVGDAERSYARLTAGHLARLSELARADHEYFTRDAGRPEYRDRRLLVTLAQGAARHWIDGRTGVKDLDVWSFYSSSPDQPFPAAKRETHADFGPSDLGRQAYGPPETYSARIRARLPRWTAYEGRRVDLLMRALPVPPGASTPAVVDAVHAWLEAGSRSRAGRKPSSWWLAQKALVVIDPQPCRGRVIWPRP